MTLADVARQIFRSGADQLGLLPIQRVLRGIERRAFDLGKARALELFARTGDRITKHYAPLVASLELWEIDPAYEAALRERFRRATVKITDSYEEVRRTDRVYDFIVVDNPATTYDGHSEHFDLFPDLFRVVADEAVVLLNVIPRADRLTLENYPDLFNETQLAHRRAFYGTDRPEHIHLPDLAAHYRKLFRDHGFETDWQFFERRREMHHLLPRSVTLYLLAMKVRRVRQPPDPDL